MDSGKLKNNAVWLYLSGDVRNEREIGEFVSWCARNAVGKTLVHLPLPPLLSEEAKTRVNSLIEACAPSGIEVHGMIGTLLQRTVNREELLFADKSCYCVDAHGISNWDEPLCGRGYVFDPNKPEVAERLSACCRELLETFPGLAGIHLDFIRYYHYESRLTVDTKNAGHWVLMPRKGHPIRFEMADGSRITYFIDEVRNAYNDPPIGDRLVLKRNYHFCFCDECLRGFEAYSGVSLPSGLTGTFEKSSWILQHHSGSWAEYRASVITRLVRTLRKAVSAQKPGAKLSAAVWYNAPYGNELRGEPFRSGSEVECFGQKWWDWTEEGLIDFVCPMDYWLAPDSFSRIVDDQLRKAGNTRHVSIYPGILRSEEYDMSAEQLQDYRNRAASLGASGVCFFHYGSWKTVI